MVFRQPHHNGGWGGFPFGRDDAASGSGVASVMFFRTPQFAFGRALTHSISLLGFDLLRPKGGGKTLTDLAIPVRAGGRPVNLSDVV